FVSAAFEAVVINATAETNAERIMFDFKFFMYCYPVMTVYNVLDLQYLRQQNPVYVNGIYHICHKHVLGRLLCSWTPFDCILRHVLYLSELYLLWINVTKVFQI